VGEHHSAEANVRFGSKADIAAPPTNVCFTPESGHRNSVVECPLCATNRHSRVFREFARCGVSVQLDVDRALDLMEQPRPFSEALFDRNTATPTTGWRIAADQVVLIYLWPPPWCWWQRSLLRALPFAAAPPRHLHGEPRCEPSLSFVHNRTGGLHWYSWDRLNRVSGVINDTTCD